MSKTATMITLLALGLSIVMLIWLGQPKYYTIEENIDQEMSINYYRLNVRSTPEGGIIGELTSNDEVTLTGNYCEYRLKEVDSLWAEIYYEGKTAWIITTALQRK